MALEKRTNMWLQGLRGLLMLPLALLVLPAQSDSDASNFQQLGDLLPTPSETRLATGAPGPAYWQQKADYSIKAELDPASKRLYGSAVITYHNASPHTLSHVWMMLDQNRFRQDSRSNLSATLRARPGTLSYKDVGSLIRKKDYEGGFNITRLVINGIPAQFRVVDTAMRVQLPQPLQPGVQLRLEVDWWFELADLNRQYGRSGYETLDGVGIFAVTQWYPRMSAYTDYGGWRHQSFLGAGEFTQEFGTFNVSITVPDGYTVAATGELQNAQEVLSGDLRKRYIRAQRSSEPISMVDEEDLRKRLRKRTSTTKKTWTYRAESVRDFAFSTSRGFLWDVMGVQLGKDGSWVTVASYYPQRAAKLWKKYASRAAALTLQVYSEHLFDYPYPVSVQVNGPAYGMEYPMLTFVRARPYEDGTYWGRVHPELAETRLHSKYSLISIVMHEVGHNYFPMIVNSDERQWAWMDEGLNTFMHFLTEQRWSEDYPSLRGWPDKEAARMKQGGVRPVMSAADTLKDRGHTGYAKPAVAMNVLRELVLGRQLFDEAFREYVNRWKFRRPTPADFFRSMEDASGTDLDWFWRSWFYGTGYVDMALVSVREFAISDGDPRKKDDEDVPQRLGDERNSSLKRYVEQNSRLRDFYDSHDEDAASKADIAAHEEGLANLTDEEKEVLSGAGYRLYELTIDNLGGVLSPIPLRLTLQGGEQEDLLVPAEAWRHDSRRIYYPVLHRDKIVAVEIDPQRATGDADTANNHYPKGIEAEPVELQKLYQQDNPMRQSR